MHFVTDFADQAVVLPLAAVVAVFLGVTAWWRALVVWVAVVGGTLATMLVLKVAAIGLMDDFGTLDPGSPSGHVAAACVVYGGLAVLMLGGVLPGVVVALIPAAIVAGIGYTRVELAAHSPLEVAIGAVVGCAGVTIMAATLGPRPRLPAWPMLAATACTALAFHGIHAPAEAAIRAALMVP
jgi:membrane-associated phospholipid phosphatase